MDQRALLLAVAVALLSTFAVLEGFAAVMTALASISAATGKDGSWNLTGFVFLCAAATGLAMGLLTFGASARRAQA